MENNITMIFTRGKNAEEQVTICEKYADENGLDIMGEINDDLEEVYSELENIDVLLVTNHARITKEAEAFEKLKTALDEHDIKLIEVK